MSSGVKVADDCITKYENIKIRHLYSYIIFRISNDRKWIIVDKLGDLGETYDDFRNKMKQAQQEGQCRYAVYDMKYEMQGKGKRDKLFLIHWSPDASNISTKEKMIYASSLRDLRQKLEGIAVEIQANDEEELNLSALLEKCH